jgi:flagellar M-ring protein FliF
MTRELENTYVQRINDLLEPMFGRSGIRAQVTADMDFSEVETTLENYNPNNREDPLLRSEQRSVSRRMADVEGVPGALSNQPPQDAVLVEGAPIASTAEQEEAAARVMGETQEVRNYELDRLIEHVRSQPGRLSRLSVAVLVDRAALPPPLEPLDEEAEAAALAAGEDPNAELLATVEQLVREAVGLQDARGDTIRVSAMEFIPEDDTGLEDLPEPPLWEEPWLWDLLRQLFGVIMVIVLLLAVLRPTFKLLARPGLVSPLAQLPGAEAPAQLGAPEESGGAPRAAPDGVQERLAYARQVVDQDPKRVAQLTRAWLAGDE